jgi:plastocyanin
MRVTVLALAALLTLTVHGGTPLDAARGVLSASRRTEAPRASVQAPAPRMSGALRGRVDIRLAAVAAERRPSVTDLVTPAPRPAPDIRRAVVYLETAPRGAFEEDLPARLRMDQRSETFVPHVLAVATGTVVDFPNNDSTYHNVFSLSKAKRFDLGRYARGRSKAVRFDQPGIVRVFCDIHSHMSAFVLVFGHPYFATTDADGRYRIDGIPPGAYTVVAWHEGQTRDSRSVVIPAQGGIVEQDFQVR